MPEPRGPQHGQETLTLGGAKPGSTFDEENQKVGQDEPGDKDRYAHSERANEEQKGAEDVANIERTEDVEDVDGTDDADEDAVPSDSLTDLETAEKQSGRMLDPKNLPEGDE